MRRRAPPRLDLQPSRPDGDIVHTIAAARGSVQAARNSVQNEWSPDFSSVQDE